MEAYRVVITIVALLAVALAVLLFERKRAERIQRDLRDQRRDGSGDPPAQPGVDPPATS